MSVTDAKAPAPFAAPADAALDDQATIIALRDLLAQSQAQVSVLLVRVAELEHRLGLNSRNSSKPPSSDGPGKPRRTQSLRGESDKPSGGQTGHPGKTLCQVATPDHVVEHIPAACAQCGAALAREDGHDPVVRQLWDLPAPQPLVVTEHRVYRCRCACGASTSAAFPETVRAPVQYGPRLHAFVVYLANAQFIPEDRISRLMDDLFGVPVSAATIAQMTLRAAARLTAFGDAVAQKILAAPVKHLDETGFRIAGRTQWLHVAATETLSSFRACAKRGSMLEGCDGIVVHDHWQPYYTMTGVKHALCNAHHLRELQALIGIEGEPWAQPMQTLLRRAGQMARQARATGTVMSPRRIALIDRRYQAILAAGLAWHTAQPALRATPPEGQTAQRGRIPRRIGHNLLRRLDDRRADVLRFVTDPSVPFTNNQAERDLRMMKLRQKISGGFRSHAGAQAFATLRTMIATAQKQGWNIIESLTQPHNLINQIA